LVSRGLFVGLVGLLKHFTVDWKDDRLIFDGFDFKRMCPSHVSMLLFSLPTVDEARCGVKFWSLGFKDLQNFVSKYDFKEISVVRVGRKKIVFECEFKGWSKRRIGLPIQVEPHLVEGLPTPTIELTGFEIDSRDFVQILKVGKVLKTDNVEFILDKGKEFIVEFKDTDKGELYRRKFLVEAKPKEPFIYAMYGFDYLERLEGLFKDAYKVVLRFGNNLPLNIQIEPYTYGMKTISYWLAPRIP